MSRLALFICISGTILWNLIKLCMNINLWNAVILLFHNVNPRGQTKVAYIKICYKTSSFICIFGYIQANISKCHVEMFQIIISIINLLPHMFKLAYAQYIKLKSIKFIMLIIIWNISNLLFSSFRRKKSCFVVTFSYFAISIMWQQ